MKAFPRADGKFDSRKRDELGMDLRDYFAAKAMQGYMNDYYDFDPIERAERAYIQADAMMKAR